MPSNTKTMSVRLAAGLAGVLSLAAAGPGRALTIAPTFDASITSSPYAATLESAINQVAGAYSMYGNPATVSISFQLSNLGGPDGRSVTALYILPYADYEFGALAYDAATHPWNQVLATAQANLAFGNTSDNIITPSANLRALGAAGAIGFLGADGVPFDGTFDGIVQLDAASVLAGDYSFTSAVGPNQDSGLDILYHEVNEVLGIGGSGSTLNFIANGVDVPGIGPLDPYRYDYFTGQKSFTTDPNGIAYFSIDGGQTPIMPFNQVNPPGFLGDYGDWGRFACNDVFHSIQQWAGCSGEPYLPFTATGPESIALQSIGYNMVPEPGTWTILILGLLGIGAALRRRSGALAV
jgi:hypothetical protein